MNINFRSSGLIILTSFLSALESHEHWPHREITVRETTAFSSGDSSLESAVAPILLSHFWMYLGFLVYLLPGDVECQDFLWWKYHLKWQGVALLTWWFQGNPWYRRAGRSWEFSLEDWDSALLSYFAILKSSFPSSRDFMGFSSGTAGKESACNTRDPGFSSCVGKIPWRREWLSTPVFLPGEFHGVYRDFTWRFLFQFVWDAKILQLGEGSVKIAIIKKDAIAQYWQRYGGRRHPHM